jgi:hypothetical protein
MVTMKWGIQLYIWVSHNIKDDWNMPADKFS